MLHGMTTACGMRCHAPRSISWVDGRRRRKVFSAFPSGRELVSGRTMFSAFLRAVVIVGAAVLLARAQDPAAAAAPAVPEPRTVESPLELQVELHRRGFSCGSIDGVPGAQTEAALRAFQRGAGLRDSGVLDQPTRAVLRIGVPALEQHTVTLEDLAGLEPMPTTWLGKAERAHLGHATILERIAERFRANPKLLERLNPEVDWDAVLAGTVVTVPAVEQALVLRPAAQLVIRLEARELEVVDADGRVVAHFPVSIARKAEKRPIGDLRIMVAVRDPNYTFDPELFSASVEAREVGRKLLVPPGPNNPVGRAWIGLDLPGYGIHGTPEPEKVGRTESLGCFRLANWDALTLLDLVRVGMTVVVEP